MTTKIFLVRHAEAEGNLFRVAHGQYDSNLTPRGYRQLHYLRERFRGEKLDAVYGSDLTRTHATASALYVPRGLDFRPEPRLREVRRSISMIFQQFNLLPVLTAKENIIMPLLLDKQKPDEAYLKQLTELLGIQGRLEHLPHELSGGQQQRVAIARALIAKPDVIFADEPTGNLDSKSGGEVMELLQNVWKKMGKALVVITHDSRIARMADRQLQIVDGVLTEVTAK